MDQKKRSRVLIVAGILFCVAGIGVAVWGWNYFHTRDRESYEIIMQAVDYTFDHNDIDYYVEDADFVFTGKVEKIPGTDYEDQVMIDGKEAGTPYTRLEVRVTEPMKGDVSQGDRVQIKKWGGITEDGKKYYSCQGDVIPEKGKTYTFLGWVRPDGEWLVSGENSTIEESKSGLLDKVHNAISMLKKEEENN